MTLYQIIQHALKQLWFLDENFVCSGVWCTETANAYKRFCVEQGIDPHFIIQPYDISHLPSVLRDYVADYKTDLPKEKPEDDEGIDLVEPDSVIVVNIGDLSVSTVESGEPATDVLSKEDEQS